MNNWLKFAQLKAIDYSEYDDCSNLYERRIFIKNGKLFSINFHNDHPNELWINGKGIIRGEYAEPIQVEEKSREIIETYYE